MHALSGIRVLDMSRILAGPFCTMLLGDFGADVIKIERPVVGDDTRHWGPPYAGTPADLMSAYYLSVNRNKRSVTLNLKSAQGQAIIRELATTADIIVENFKQGTTARFGLDYDALKVLNPKLVYCHISAYGDARPGYDFAIQGESGLMSITGPAEGEPYKVGVAISDVITGLMAANAIQAALFAAQSSGAGQYIDIALLDAQIAALVNVASNYLISGQEPMRYGNAHPNIVPYQAFAALDKSFILAVGNDAQFRACCSVIDRPALANDARFLSNSARLANRDKLLNILEPIFAQQPAEYWVTQMLAAGVPASFINSVSEAFRNDYTQNRDLIERVTLANGESIDILAPIAKLSATPTEIRYPPPLLGQHTEEVLGTLLDAETMQEYRQQGVI